MSELMGNMTFVAGCDVGVGNGDETPVTIPRNEYVTLLCSYRATINSARNLSSGVTTLTERAWLGRFPVEMVLDDIQLQCEAANEHLDRDEEYLKAFEAAHGHPVWVAGRVQ